MGRTGKAGYVSCFDLEKGRLREVRRRADMQGMGWGASSWRRKEEDIREGETLRRRGGWV